VEAKTRTAAEQLAIDYLALPGNRGEQSVTVFFTKLDNVTRQIEVLEAAGLEPASLEGSMQATVECLRFNEYLKPAETCVVVDVGETHTSAALVAGGYIRQLHTVRGGAGDINEHLMEQTDCTYAEAEAMKLGLRLDEDHEDPVKKLIEESYGNLIVAVHDTVAYYRAAFKDQLIMNVILTGGGAQKEGLDHLLQQSLNLPVERANPLRRIQIFTPGDDREKLIHLAPYFHAAIGLALRSL
jgi:type IV pilus assembly protein PilM